MSTAALPNASPADDATDTISSRHDLACRAAGVGALDDGSADDDAADGVGKSDDRGALDRGSALGKAALSETALVEAALSDVALGMSLIPPGAKGWVLTVPPALLPLP
mmetsp:Transcript_32474/g.64734  ORF Transcript_32474/g.64734 Transcript_32474/m.64734 type:complete len:108 (-) Transcript_32474:10-333(-)